MNLEGALSSVQLKRHKTKSAVTMAVKNAKCCQQFALLAEKIPMVPFNGVKRQFIVASVLYPQHVATGKSLIVETFLGLNSLGRFLF